MQNVHIEGDSSAIGDLCDHITTADKCWQIPDSVLNGATNGQTSGKLKSTFMCCCNTGHNCNDEQVRHVQNVPNVQNASNFQKSDSTKLKNGAALNARFDAGFVVIFMLTIFSAFRCSCY
jgi:hypothetical protein